MVDSDFLFLGEANRLIHAFFFDVLILLQTSSGLDKVFLAHTFLYRVLVPLGRPWLSWAVGLPVPRLELSKRF